MKILTILFLALSPYLLSLSEEDPKQEIKAAVDTMFKGMYTGDSAMVHSVFVDDAKMQTTFTTKEGEEKFTTGSLDRFLKAVGTPHDIKWDERIWDLKIEVDDNLAHAWMNYAFYLGEEFSHCGVNAMQLVKFDGAWKIVNIIDTRRKVDCNIPDNLK